MIYQVLDNEPVFSDVELKILNWASDYYHHPIGEVMGTFLPTNLRNVKTVMDVQESFSGHTSPDNSFVKNLTQQQTEAVDILSKLKGFQPTLLYGVTGSGKTEVYAQLAKKSITKNKQVLILVPEISLTPQTIQVSGNPAKWLQGHNLFGTNDLKLLMTTFFSALYETMAEEGLNPTIEQCERIAEGRYTISRVDINETWFLKNQYEQIVGADFLSLL